MVPYSALLAKFPQKNGNFQNFENGETKKHLYRALKTRNSSSPVLYPSFYDFMIFKRLINIA